MTSLRTLKNLLLIGDVVKSISFVAFQVRFQPHILQDEVQISVNFRRSHISLSYLRRISTRFA